MSSVESSQNQNLVSSTEAQHSHGGAGVVVDYASFRVAYLATDDAEEVACDNETPERMEGRVGRVWKHFTGDMEQAIRKADEEEMDDGLKTDSCSSGDETSPADKMNSTISNTKTYGHGKLRINLNSPRGNIYAVWGVALNLMNQCLYTKEEKEKNLAELRVGKYEDCLEAFGKHKVFGSMFKLYYSPEYMMDWDEGEWGNPNEEDSDSEEEEDYE
jgi:hypothetical protein